MRQMMKSYYYVVGIYYYYYFWVRKNILQLKNFLILR